MTSKNIWLLAILFVAACNNDSTTTTTPPADEHAGHSAVAGGNYSDSVNNGLIAEDKLKGSPHRTAMAIINGNHVHIEYNSPGVRGRVIWDELVPYDRVWVAGAHKATSVRFSRDVEIAGKKIPAGQYAFFVIPGKGEWTAILNSRYDQHLADDYDQKEDVVRLQVQPEDHTLTPRLTYLVNKLDEKKGEIVLQWEKKQVRVPFSTM